MTRILLKYCLAVKELALSYCNKETFLLTIYPSYGDLSSIRACNPVVPEPLSLNPTQGLGFRGLGFSLNPTPETQHVRPGFTWIFPGAVPPGWRLEGLLVCITWPRASTGMWGFPKIRGTFLGVLRTRIIVFWDIGFPLFWETTILGCRVKGFEGLGITVPSFGLRGAARSLLQSPWTYSKTIAFDKSSG